MTLKSNLLWLALVILVGSANVGSADLITTFSSAADLNFGNHVVYAIDFPGAGGTVNGVTFTDENAPGVTVNSNFFPDPWGAAPDYGATADDDALESIMGGIRAGLNGGSVSIDLAVDPGVQYRLQMMFSDNFWTSSGQRSFDVSIEGQEVLTDFDILAVTGNWSGQPTVGALYVSDLVQASDGVLSIQLDPGSGVHPDTNPLINGLTLTAVPEPGAAGLWAIGILVLAGQRRRKERSL